MRTTETNKQMNKQTNKQNKQLRPQKEHMVQVLPWYLMKSLRIQVQNIVQLINFSCSLYFIIESYSPTATVWRTGKTAFTASLTTNFRNKVPLCRLLAFESKVESVQGRKSFLQGKITSLDGKTVYAEGNGLWIESPKITSIHMKSFL